ncbi:GNAT family N-acetyltransferase [Nonomuraea typhae]|uniref:GNAT family N-acetyltransferase n=1 Tax=Nonomuraea typhae TaxID=2603600 RepID=UPI0015E1BA38|nr:GNAT family N-acetyltransferase [Nonomuraea typhae]
MFPRDVLSAGPLLLRPPSHGDLGAIVEASNDPVMARFMPLLPSPYTTADAQGYLALAARRWDEGGAEFTVTRDGRHVGAIGLTPPDRWGTVSMGYWVAPAARGAGVAGTAARAVADWALDHGARRVELEAEVENLGSLRVAYKAGFRQEGVRREAKALRDGRRSDLVTFGRLPGEAVETAGPYFPFFRDGHLTDGVVRLAPMAEEHAQPFMAMLEEPVVRRYSLMPPSPLAEHVRRCRYTGFWWMSGQRVELAITDAATGAFAGHVQLVNVTQVLHQAMVGYALMPSFHGRGFMSRALALLVDWAFSATPLRRLTAGTNVDNAPSHRVLERAGFARESVHRQIIPSVDGGWADDVTWELLHPKLGEKS